MSQYKRQRASSGSGSTIHPLFEKIKGNRSIADLHFTGINNTYRKFTEIFEILFPGDIPFSDNVCTWLQLISTWFYFPKENVSTEIQEKVKALFCDLVINLKHDDSGNKQVFEFLLFLNMIYTILQRIGYVRDDKVFQFFTGTNFRHVKVAFIGKDPSPVAKSLGYAFHLSNAESTKIILDRATQETNFYMKLNERTVLSDEDISTFINNCDMTNWIDNGVLLMNSSLTYHETSQFEINAAWQYFTDFVVTSLTRRRDNIVFALLGKVAAQKERLIDKKKHLVMMIHHPGMEFYNNDENKHRREKKSYLEWHRKLPFINANFYLYQCGDDLVNWIPTSSAFSSDSALFRNVMEDSKELRDEAGDFLKYRDEKNLLVFRRGNGKLLVRWQDTSEQFSNETN